MNYSSYTRKNLIDIIHKLEHDYECEKIAFERAISVSEKFLKEIQIATKALNKCKEKFGDYAFLNKAIKEINELDKEKYIEREK